MATSPFFGFGICAPGDPYGELDLDRVGVLELVEHDPLIRLLKRCPRFATLAQQVTRGDEKIVELELTRGNTSLRIGTNSDRNGAGDRAQQCVRKVPAQLLGSHTELDDLRPQRPEDGVEWIDPDAPRTKDVADAAIDALVAVVVEAARTDPPQGPVASRAARVMRRVRGRRS